MHKCCLNWSQNIIKILAIVVFLMWRQWPLCRHICVDSHKNFGRRCISIYQGWPDFFSRGPKLKILFLVNLKICSSRKIYRLFFPFLIIFDAYWEKNQTFFKLLVLIWFFEFFFQTTKGPRAAKTSWRAELWPPLVYTVIVLCRRDVTNLTSQI